MTFLTILLLIFPGVSFAESPQGLKIGYIVDLTGVGAFLSSQTQRGAELAESVLPQRNSSSPSIEIIYEDIGGKTSNALAAAKKLLEFHHVDAVICDLTAPCTAVAKTIEDAGKVLIYHSPATSIAASHSQSFRNFIDYDDACGKIAEYWKRNGASSIGSVNANLEFGQRCFEGIERIVPDHFSYRNNPGDDLRSSPLEFSKRKLSHIIFTGYEIDFISLVKYAHQQGIPFTVGTIELLLTDATWKQLGTIPVRGVTAGFDRLTSELQRLVKRDILESRTSTSLRPRSASTPSVVFMKPLPFVPGKLSSA